MYDIAAHSLAIKELAISFKQGLLRSCLVRWGGQAGRLRAELVAQRNAVQAAHRSSRVSSQEESRKLLGSSARLLTSQFQPDCSYSGQVGAPNFSGSNN